MGAFAKVTALTAQCDSNHIQYSGLGIYKMHEEVTYERCRSQNANRSKEHPVCDGFFPRGGSWLALCDWPGKTIRGQSAWLACPVPRDVSHRRSRGYAAGDGSRRRTS